MTENRNGNLSREGELAGLRLVPDAAKPGLPLLEWRPADAVRAEAAAIAALEPISA